VSGTLDVEFRALSPEWATSLADLFAALAEGEDERSFHPHPLTEAEAARVARNAGGDVYSIAIAGDRVVGYGLLRGWDEGYVVPSLGIAVHPTARGLGVGRALMIHLHEEARKRNAPSIRLKVYPTNTPALALYESLGYVFDGGEDNGQLVGTFEL
jgi:ribosomal-protein-alanine N-acetyltransferase